MNKERIRTNRQMQGGFGYKLSEYNFIFAYGLLLRKLRWAARTVWKNEPPLYTSQAAQAIIIIQGSKHQENLCFGWRDCGPSNVNCITQNVILLF